ncbi:hypothetical protein ABIA65_003548 [Mycolicibacterium sp. 624]
MPLPPGLWWLVEGVRLSYLLPVILSCRAPGATLKLRTSTSLTAAACTLCIVAASGTMAPQAIAATPVGSAVTPTVSRSYELTALPSPLLLASLSLGSAGAPPVMALGRAAAPSVQSFAAPAATVNEVLALASLPVQNLWTVLTTLGQLTNFVTPLNKAMALVATGLTTGNWNVDAITAQVQAAIDVTITAIRNIINLPATIINTDIQAIRDVLNPTAQAGLAPFAAVAAAPNVMAVQASNPINDFLKVASLPAQNAWTVVTTFGQLTNFVTPLNKAMALVATGLTTGNWNVDAIGAQVRAAIDVTVTAVRNIVNLPATIIKHDIDTIGGIFNPPAQVTARSAVQTLRTTTTLEAPPSGAADGVAADDAAAAGKEKHSWESLQNAVRSAFASEVAAFDGTLPAAVQTPAEDAPAKDAPAEGTPVKDAPAKDTEAKDPNKGETTKDTPAKDADKDQAAKDGKDSSGDKKADDKKDTAKKADDKDTAKHDTAKKDTAKHDTAKKDGSKDKDSEKSAAA